MNNYNSFDSYSRESVSRFPEIERPGEDKIPERKRPLILKIAVWVLLVAVALYLLYSIFVHPVDKLRLRLILGQSCRIRVLVDVFGGYGEATVKVDGNLISVTVGQSVSETEYYEVDGDKIYTYELRQNGEWERVDTLLSSITIGGGEGEKIEFLALLDSRNYERVEGELFVWRIKEGVNVGGLENVKFQRQNGKYMISAKVIGEYTYLKFFFDRIGTTVIIPPWEE